MSCVRNWAKSNVAVGAARIADIDSVHEHFRVIGIGAPHEYRCDATGASVLDEIQSRDFLQDVGQRPLLSRGDIVGGNDGDAAGDLRLRCRQAGLRRRPRVAWQHPDPVSLRRGSRRPHRSSRPMPGPRRRRGERTGICAYGLGPPQQRSDGSSQRIPAAPSTPRPETGRRREAGLLASGSSLSSAFPRHDLSGISNDRSPVTVAGAAAEF